MRSHKIFLVPGICSAGKLMLNFDKVKTKGLSSFMTDLFREVCLLKAATTAILSQ